MPTVNTSLTKKRVIIKVLLVFSIAAFLLVVAYVIFLKTTSGDNTGEISPVPGGTAETSRQRHNFPDIWESKGSKPGTRGGVIGFKPAGGRFSNSVMVQLSVDSPLKSVKGDSILSDIYYTLDSTVPSKTNGKKYTPGNQISLTKQEKITIKARLISKLGNGYEGEVYTQTYNLEPDLGQHQVTRYKIPKNAVTNLELLDRNTREEIEKKMNRIVIEVEGITRINRTGHLNILLSISKAGDAKMLDISGFTVEPAGKLDDIKSQLDQKIQGIQFAAPTRKGKPVDVTARVDFNKIATFYEKVIIEGINR